LDNLRDALAEPAQERFPPTVAFEAELARVEIWKIFQKPRLQI
jgi:hypothetical protein